jgi:hypothetical protein
MYRTRYVVCREVGGQSNAYATEEAGDGEVWRMYQRERGSKPGAHGPASSDLLLRTSIKPPHLIFRPTCADTSMITAS